MSNETKHYFNEIVEKALDIGELMLETGAEVTRVEDTLFRICSTYVNGKIDVFTIVSLIIISIRTEQGEYVTQTRRIYGYATDFDKLERLNALSREICSEHLSVKEIENRINQIFENQKNQLIKKYVGYVLAASSFAIFFGGTLRDGIAAGIVSILFCFYETVFKNKNVNKILYTFLSSVFVGFLSIIVVLVSIGEHADMIMIGNIMLLIPGISFMNSVKDMLCGDTMTGMLRLIESILISVTIAIGFAVALLSLGKFIQL